MNKFIAIFFIACAVAALLMSDIIAFAILTIILFLELDKQNNETHPS